MKGMLARTMTIRLTVCLPNSNTDRTDAIVSAGQVATAEPAQAWTIHQQALGESSKRGDTWESSMLAFISSQSNQISARALTPYAQGSAGSGSGITSSSTGSSGMAGHPPL